MGTYHEDGYSSEVRGFLVVRDRRFRLAKTNGKNFVLSEECELPPGTEGELLIILDGREDSRRIKLPGGVSAGDLSTSYEVLAPF